MGAYWKESAVRKLEAGQLDSILQENIVACQLDQREIPGFFNKRIVVGLNEAAIVAENGKVTQILSHGKQREEEWHETLNRWLGSRTRKEIVYVSLVPIRETFYTDHRMEDSHKGLLTIDNEYISMHCTYQLELVPEQIVETTRLLNGQDVLYRPDLCARVEQVFLSSVLQPQIARLRSDELRGNTSLSEELQKQAKMAVARHFGEAGLECSSFEVLWGITGEEQDQIAERQAQRSENMQKFEHERGLRQHQRQLELDRTRLMNLQEVKILEARGEHELAQLCLNAELEESKTRQIEQAELDAQVLRIKLDIQDQEWQVQLEQRRSTEFLNLEIEQRKAQQRVVEAEASVKLKQNKMEHLVALKEQKDAAKHLRWLEARRTELENDFRKQQEDNQTRLAELRMRLEENIIRIQSTKDLLTGLSDAVTPDVLIKYLEQNTDQQYAAGSDEKVRARAEAQGAQHKLETYQQAEDRERRHQIQSTAQAADLMDASKQPAPGQVVVQSGGAIPNTSKFVAHLPGVSSERMSGEAGLCAVCQAKIQPTWKLCPECGQRLLCGSCGIRIHASWKVCPECEQVLTP